MRVDHVVRTGGENRVDHVASMLVSPEVAHPLTEKFGEVSAGLVRSLELVAQAFDGQGNGSVEREAVAAREDDVDGADAGPPEREGIGGAGRPFADAEDAGQRVEPVGQSHQSARVALGQFVAGKARQIVLEDRLCHAVALHAARVFAAHHSLQLGKFADHAGHEVGLAQVGGALDGGVEIG